MTMMSATRSFSIDLPEGMASIPVAAVPGTARSLAATLAGTFGLPADDASAAVVADAFTVFGAMLGESGMDFAAMGLFRSPDDPDRPASVVVTGNRVPSDHATPEVAIAGLRDLHAEQGADPVETVALPAGPALVVVDETIQEMPTEDGVESAVVVTRRATAWIPDPAGTTIAVVSVMSPSWQDWAHTCELALDLFETFRWEAAR
ncbi:MAG TPA: hypothetical protein VHX38_16870 [Pseudonocardiaceae bacterium]|jgi:hypothetical protein|nr:hypothetical protein [Pseudonocardiaceae bacterium]